MSIIKQGRNNQIRPNFSEGELQSTSWKRGYDDMPILFELSDRTLDALQQIRDYYGVPMIINSTGRSPRHNKAIGGASKSQHLPRYNGSIEPTIGVIPTVTAVDWRFKDYDKPGTPGYEAHNDFYNQMKSPNWMHFPAIYNNDINGVGLYDNFYHIDSRETRVSQPWDLSSKKKSESGEEVSNITYLKNNLTNENEDGILGAEKTLKKIAIWTVLIVVLAIVGYFLYKKYVQK